MTVSIEIEEECHTKELLPRNTEKEARLAAWAMKRLEIIDRYIPVSSQQDLAKSWARSSEAFSPHDPMNQLHIQQNEFQLRKAGVDLDSLQLELRDFEMVKTAMQIAHPEHTSLVELKGTSDRPFPGGRIGVNSAPPVGKRLALTVRTDGV